MRDTQPTRRDRQHDATREEIKQLARQQMADEGTAAISLRAIARQMGLTAPALYRYFPDRDALITALIVDAYTDQADALEAARDAYLPHEYAKRLYAAVLEYRAWAVRRSTDYVLIYGNPIPGYNAPAEQTLPPARRIMNLFVSLIHDAWKAGAATPPSEFTEILPQFQARILGDQTHYGHLFPHPAFELAIIMFARIHGMISLELFHHTDALIADPGELYRFELIAVLARMGLQVDPESTEHGNV